jgi:mono/diheme cytochrome c family protein
MTRYRGGIGLLMAVLLLALAAPAGAQENLDSGKSGAQLFASNCALCHKSAQALNKSGGLFGLSGFLREHYTASRESADIIATYVQSFGNAPAHSKRTGAAKRTAKTSGPKSEPKSEPKTSEPKSGEAKPDAAPAAKPDKPD